MSEPIQSIAQNNYILHNIDAKKLYVQEPLFTANSGDAVYVGWRPDETLLFSADAPGGTITLSESPLNFNEIKMTFGNTHGSQITNNFGEDTVYYDPTDRNAILFNGVFDSNATTTGVNSFIEYYVSYTGCSGTNWTRTKCMFKAINATAWGGTESWLRDLKIWGCNRKENA